VGGNVRWIDVDLSQQRLTAYEGQKVVRTVLVSTGLSQTPTPVGRFRIYVKYRYDDMSGPDYYLADVPYVMYFYRGYGLHGTYWHDNFGQPMSHGCVNLPTSEAAWLFEWASLGTLVNIHE
jgi:lipoprotein-anchoring transpeptidase ErfK/SrfK